MTNQLVISFFGDCVIIIIIIIILRDYYDLSGNFETGQAHACLHRADAIHHHCHRIHRCHHPLLLPHHLNLQTDLECSPLASLLLAQTLEGGCYEET